jgi:hypothetical protein
VLGALNTLLGLVSGVLVTVVPLLPQQTTNELTFVIGTCWPQVYDQDPTRRLNSLLDSEDLSIIETKWEKVWGDRQP